MTIDDNCGGNDFDGTRHAPMNYPMPSGRIICSSIYLTTLMARIRYLHLWAVLVPRALVDGKPMSSRPDCALVISAWNVFVPFGRSYEAFRSRTAP